MFTSVSDYSAVTAAAERGGRDIGRGQTDSTKTDMLHHDMLLSYFESATEKSFSENYSIREPKHLIPMFLFMKKGNKNKTKTRRRQDEDKTKTKRRQDEDKTKTR